MEITGQYVKTIFRNPVNGYTKFFFLDREGQSRICVGRIPRYTEKTPLLLIGHEQKQQWGRRQEIIFILEYSMPYWNDQIMDKQYILANLCTGHGAATADKILKACGYDINRLLKEENMTSMLSEATGMSESKTSIFLSKIRMTEVSKDVYKKLYPYGCSFRMAEAAYQKYGTKALQGLQEDPYSFGISCNMEFGMIDRYARNNGHFYAENGRVQWILRLTAKEIPKKGSTYVSLETALWYCHRIEYQYGAYDIQIPDIIFLFFLSQSGYFYIENADVPRVFPAYLYRAETGIAAQCKKILSHQVSFIEKEAIDDMIRMDSILDTGQKECYKIFAKTGISIITGGPGTGKTTTIKQLISFFRKQKPKCSCSLCAPTGRAAERITEATGIKATTIHMLLEYKSLFGQDAGPTRDHNNPLDSDVFIIDEFSMVGVSLFYNFLDAVKEECVIILVGDPDQLKSVEAGNVLGDMLESGIFPVYRLTYNHRQGDGNVIIDNARKILNQQCDLITNEHFHIYRSANEQELMQGYRKILENLYLPEKPMVVQALGVMNGKSCGVIEMNKIAQDMFQDDDIPKIYMGKQQFFINDKVMTLRNNYDKGYMNGDIGTLEKFDEDGMFINCGGQTIIVSMNEGEDVTLAYAITVHKSQGSEAEKIIIVLPHDVPDTLLDNSLIYVGVTRAKSEVFIISEMDALEKAIMNKKKTIRKTTLKERLIACHKG